MEKSNPPSTNFKRILDFSCIPLSILAALSLLLGRRDWLFGLEGTRNGSFSAGLMQLYAFGLWLLLSGFLFLRVVYQLHRWSTRMRIIGMAALLLPQVPFLLPTGPKDSESAFIEGLSNWTSSQIPVDELRRWQQANPSLPTESQSSPFWFYVHDLKAPARPIRRSAWPASLTALNPDEVAFLPDQSGLVLVYHGHFLGWLRFVYIGPENTRLPPQFTDHPLKSIQVREGVAVGVVRQH